jgi:2-methylcitrate dehydratase PrpD
MRVPRTTRRAILQGGLGALAASSLPRPAVSATPPGPIITALSSYMSEAGTRPLPPEIVEKTKHIVLDTFAAMISGAELQPGKFAIQVARTAQTPQGSTVAASRVLCPPVEAALANGMLAHADETDDTHPFSQSHPGCSVVPSSLAVGEQFGIDGNRFLRAVALGYDIGPRVTITLGKIEYMVASHRSTHSISGTFGSAAAAGSAAGLNARQMRWLLSYTAQQASGLASWQRDTDHIEKAFDFGGMPARNGVTAAMLVASGGTGVDDIFTGADNFLQAFLPRNDASLLTEKLGERYEITRTSLKKWTVGAPIQAPLDALDLLEKRGHFEADQVTRVVVRVATDEATIVDNREIPDICLQHLVAVMLLDKTVSFKSAHDTARMKDPAVLRQRAKVQLVHDPELQKRMPHREATVELTLTDGKQLSEHVSAVRGTADNPMTREDVVAKARDLMAPSLGADASSRLIETVLRLETVKNVRELRPLLQRG